jgi:hypothetical protein
VFVVLVLCEFVIPAFVPDTIGTIFAFGLYRVVVVD